MTNKTKAADMKAKVDFEAAAAIEKVVAKFVRENPRLKLSYATESVDDVEATEDGREVVDVYREYLKLVDPN